MYELRRTYVTLPGEERRVASLLQKQCEILVEAGQRSPFHVSFNGGTCPGEKQRVYLTWTAEKIESPYRAGNVMPPAYAAIGTERNKYTTDTWIEIAELMNSDKLADG